MNEAEDPLFKKYNVKTEDELFKAMEREKIQKFQALNLSAREEARLRKQHKLSEEKTYTEIITSGGFFNLFLGDPKPKKAALVFECSLHAPKLSITKMCHMIGISQGYFRELRLIHKKEWVEQCLDYSDSCFINTIVDANDEEFSNKQWSDFYGEKDNRDNWKVKRISRTE